jgi:flagellar motor switch protein FliG
LPGDSPQQTVPALTAGGGERLPAAPTAGARLPGARKAAVLMAALGSERAANVLQRLGEQEIESLSLEIARLSPVGAETADSVFNELAIGAGRAGGSVTGGVDFVRDLVERALGPERAAEVLGRLSSTEARPFEFLRRVAPERIAALLRSESPQTAALVLASLHTNLAANVLGKFPEAAQPEIALRIARMGPTSARVIGVLEHTLRERLTLPGEQEYAKAGGPKALAEILNHADRALERNVLENLANADGDLAEKVRGMLFVFEDIAKLEERAVQQVLREVDQKDLVLALRGAPESVSEVVLSNMSERGAAMLKEEMEIQPPQRKRDIDQAQSRIVAVVRRLEEAGTIAIGGGDSEEESEAVV